MTIGVHEVPNNPPKRGTNACCRTPMEMVTDKFWESEGIGLLLGLGFERFSSVGIKAWEVEQGLGWSSGWGWGEGQISSWFLGCVSGQGLGQGLAFSTGIGLGNKSWGTAWERGRSRFRVRD